MTIGGITVGYDDVGHGPALVLVHGHPFDRTMWRQQRDRFRRCGLRVITPDLRGYGESTVVPGHTPLETFAHDLVALLDRLGVDRFVLGGLSMGGQVVLATHRLVRHRIRALVLAATSAHAEDAEGRAARNAMADRLLHEGMRGYAREVLPRMLAPRNISMLPVTARHVLRMMEGTPPAGAAAALRGRADRPDYVADLGDITVPTLVVAGEADDYAPVELAKDLHARIPRSSLAVIDGAAHLPNLEREVVFNDTVLMFLQDAVGCRLLRCCERRRR